MFAAQLMQGYVLQIFAQPVFENVETFITERQLWPSSRPRLMRAVVRSLYVALTTFVAICLPFFADLMGLIGAAGFTPMTFILPCVFWIKVGLVPPAPRTPPLACLLLLRAWRLESYGLLFFILLFLITCSCL